jgi:hypothetical protein
MIEIVAGLAEGGPVRRPDSVTEATAAVAEGLAVA